MILTLPVMPFSGVPLHRKLRQARQRAAQRRRRSRRTSVLPELTGSYCFLLTGFTGFYRVSIVLIKFYQVLPSFQRLSMSFSLF